MEAGNTITWGRCTWIVGATLLIGIVVSLWWPLWLMPPHFSGTSIVYVAISQLWLLALIVCGLLRPAHQGWQRMLKLFVAGWPFAAVALWQLVSFAWSSLLNSVEGSGNSTSIIVAAFFTWLICYAVLPIFALRQWFMPKNEPPVAPRTLAGLFAVGIVITIIYTSLINPNMVRANGGYFTAPLTCEKPIVSQDQLRYTCREFGSFGSLQTYSLEGWQGFPFGQLKSHSGNDNLGG